MQTHSASPSMTITQHTANNSSHAFLSRDSTWTWRGMGVAARMKGCILRMAFGAFCRVGFLSSALRVCICPAWPFCVGEQCLLCGFHSARSWYALFLAFCICFGMIRCSTSWSPYPQPPPKSQVTPSISRDGSPIVACWRVANGSGLVLGNSRWIISRRGIL